MFWAGPVCLYRTCSLVHIHVLNNLSSYYIRHIIISRYNISYGELPDGLDFSGSDEESIPPENGNGSGGQAQRSSSSSVRRKMSASSRRSSSFNISQEKVTCYRWVS